MTRLQFDELVRRIEARYAGRPAALERSTSAWMALGRAGILSWPAALFLLGSAAFAGGVVIEPGAGLVLLGIGVLLLVYMVSQAGLLLLVEVDPPAGRPLRPGEAPALGEILASLGRNLQCRPFDEVRATMDFNAGVREIPRLGLFGWPRTILEIGLPLASTLSADELRAVLAHEFAHLSARHGRTGGRIYRLHRTWSEAFARMQATPAGRAGRAVRWAVSRFVGWYWPRFHARAMVLSRAQEFHADRVAAEVAGGSTLASALWRIECLNPWFSERFWVDLRGQAEDRPEPPPDVLDRIRSALDAPPSPRDAARWTGRGRGRATGNDDTHPAFAERARALGLSGDGIGGLGFPAPVHPSAAEVFLGADLEAVEAELSSRWRRDEQAAWRDRHRRASAEARRRPDPDRPGPPPDTSALWEAAREAADVRGLAAAEPILRGVLDRDPAHAGASVLLGHYLLGLGDEGGERLLVGVVDRADEVWMTGACEALQGHYRATGQVDRLGEVRARLDRHEADLAEARRERSEIRSSDPFLAHGLADEQVGPLRALLVSDPACAAAWLVRKDLRYFPRRLLFVLRVRGTTSRWIPGHSERDRDLARRLSPRVELPGQVLVIARNGHFRKLADKVASLPGSEVYRKDRAGT